LIDIQTENKELATKTSMTSSRSVSRTRKCFHTFDRRLASLQSHIHFGNSVEVARSLITSPRRGLSLVIHLGQPIHNRQDHEYNYSYSITIHPNRNGFQKGDLTWSEEVVHPWVGLIPNPSHVPARFPSEKASSSRWAICREKRTVRVVRRNESSRKSNAISFRFLVKQQRSKGDERVEDTIRLIPSKEGANLIQYR